MSKRRADQRSVIRRLAGQVCGGLRFAHPPYNYWRVRGAMKPSGGPRSGQIVDVARGDDLFQRADRASAPAVLDLPQVAATAPGALGELVQRVAAMLAPHPNRVL